MIHYVQFKFRRNQQLKLRPGWRTIQRQPVGDCKPAICILASLRTNKRSCGMFSCACIKPKIKAICGLTTEQSDCRTNEHTQQQNNEHTRPWARITPQAVGWSISNHMTQQWVSDCLSLRHGKKMVETIFVSLRSDSNQGGCFLFQRCLISMLVHNKHANSGQEDQTGVGHTEMLSVVFYFFCESLAVHATSCRHVFLSFEPTQVLHQTLCICPNQSLLDSQTFQWKPLMLWLTAIQLEEDKCLRILHQKPTCKKKKKTEAMIMSKQPSACRAALKKTYFHRVCSGIPQTSHRTFFFTHPRKGQQNRPQLQNWLEPFGEQRLENRTPNASLKFGHV